MLGNLVPSENPLPGVQVANFLLCFHMVVSVSELSGVFLIKTLILSKQGFILSTSFKPNYSHKDHICKYGHIVHCDFSL